jgi:hypothetical protein
MTPVRLKAETAADDAGSECVGQDQAPVATRDPASSPASPTPSASK